MIVKTDLVEGHYHLVYLNSDGSALVAYAGKHTHDVVGLGEAGPVLGEFDGHNHTALEMIESKPVKSDESDSDLAKRLCMDYRESVDCEYNIVKKAREAEDFFNGDQWDSSHRNKLESVDRAALTINMIEPTIDLLLGHRRQSPTDLKFSPYESSDEEAANIFNETARQIREQNRFQSAKSDVERDQAVVGRGLFHIYNDTRSLDPKIVMESYCWDDVTFGKHNKVDCSDLKALFKRKWKTKEEIKRLWPDKAKDVESGFQRVADPEFSESRDLEESRGYDFDSSMSSFVDTKRKDMLVLECEELFTDKVPVLVNAFDGFKINVQGWDKSDIEAAKKFPGVSIINTFVDKLRRTHIIGSMFLDSEVVDDEGGYSIIPVYGKKTKNDWWGKVRPAMDAQRALNKFTSQAVDIVNRMGSYGYGIDQNTFANPTERKKFEDEAGSPGFVVELRDANRPIQKFEGIKIPAEVLALKQGAADDLKAILNVRPDLPMGDRTSAAAMMTAMNQALAGNEFLVSNMEQAERLVGIKLMKLIQKLYRDKPGKVMRMIYGVSQDPQADEQKKNFIAEVLSKDDLQFDIAITDAPHSQTSMINTFIVLQEMARAGMQIPPDAMIQASPIPNSAKSGILQGMAAQAQAAAESEKQKYQTEITKTQIAKSGDQQPAPQQMQAQMM